MPRQRQALRRTPDSAHPAYDSRRTPQSSRNEPPAASIRRAWGGALHHAILVIIVAFVVVTKGGPAFGEALTIYYVERPPYSHTLPDGTAAGLLVDAVRDILRLTDINFELREMPVPRILQTLDDADHTGAALGFFRTPARMEKFKFSDAVYDDGPLLIVHNSPAFLQNMEDAKLARILEQPGIRMGAMAGYSYGEMADAILKTHEKSVHRISGNTGQLYKMLAAGRIDGFLARNPDMNHVVGTDGEGTNHAILRDVPLHQHAT